MALVGREGGGGEVPGGRWWALVGAGEEGEWRGFTRHVEVRCDLCMNVRGIVAAQQLPIAAVFCVVVRPLLWRFCVITAPQARGVREWCARLRQLGHPANAQPPQRGNKRTSERAGRNFSAQCERACRRAADENQRVVCVVFDCNCRAGRLRRCVAPVCVVPRRCHHALRDPPWHASPGGGGAGAQQGMPRQLRWWQLLMRRTRLL